MHWFQCKKPELISIDHFWKNETWPSKKSKKVELFLRFFLDFLKTDHVYRLFDCFCEVSWSTDINSTETSHVLCTILEKNGKNCKRGSIFLGLFGQSSHIFSKMWVLVFCVAISASRRFFWAIKRCYPAIFIFHLCKGVPLLGRFLKKSAHMPKIGRNAMTNGRAFDLFVFKYKNHPNGTPHNKEEQCFPRCSRNFSQAPLVSCKAR